ncbi:hypothetical protein Scep_015227 [Stephania cephalantha]|uniref:Uncharacterized protein n=1 Tax=Stephania cephalantha TaxID=152367 RepID=A0AAP0J2M1_9MAGN
MATTQQMARARVVDRLIPDETQQQWTRRRDFDEAQRRDGLLAKKTRGVGHGEAADERWRGRDDDYEQADAVTVRRREGAAPRNAPANGNDITAMAVEEAAIAARQKRRGERRGATRQGACDRLIPDETQQQGTRRRDFNEA